MSGKVRNFSVCFLLGLTVALAGCRRGGLSADLESLPEVGQASTCVRVEASSAGNPPRRLVSALRDLTLTIISDSPGDWDSTAWQRSRKEAVDFRKSATPVNTPADTTPKTSTKRDDSNTATQEEFAGMLQDNRRRKLAVSSYIQGNDSTTQPVSSPADRAEKLRPSYSPNLKVEVESDLQNPQPGENVTFTITVMNETAEILSDTVIRFEPGNKLCYLRHRLAFDTLLRNGWVGCDAGQGELRFCIDRKIRPGEKFVLKVTCAVKL